MKTIIQDTFLFLLLLIITAFISTDADASYGCVRINTTAGGEYSVVNISNGISGTCAVAAPYAPYNVLTNSEFNSLQNLISGGGGSLTQAQFNALLLTASQMVALSSVVAGQTVQISALNNQVNFLNSSIATFQSQLNSNSQNIANIYAVSGVLVGTAQPFDSAVGAAFFSFALAFVVGCFLLARNAGMIIDAVKRF